MALCAETKDYMRRRQIRRGRGTFELLIDITLEITQQMMADVRERGEIFRMGHLGTHFDVMGKEFPLAYTQLPGVVFDVRSILDRDIETTDFDLEAVHAGMFVAFYTGWIEQIRYGTPAYYDEQPQLSDALIETLLSKGVSVIGIDFGGARRGKAHAPMDRYCAERGTFIIENLCNLQSVIDAGGTFTACAYPMRFSGMTGLPCRVIARIP